MKIKQLLSSILPFFLFLICCFQSNLTYATHIVGGEMTYQCLGNNNYRITLKVYRDCKNGIPPYDFPAVVGIFDVNSNRVKTVEMTQVDSVTIPTILTDPCLVNAPDICVSRAIYTATVNLPFLAGGYTLAYQRCCRNNSINNIVMPENTGATYPCYISEIALQTCNSSPVFTNFPPPLICNNRDIVFDHSATDADGDLLVYKMCTPFTGKTPQAPLVSSGQWPDAPPYQPLTWIAPYNLANIMGGIPLTINAQTGLLTGRPNTLGQFVVGVCVEEYRNGVLIGTTRRDFQYNVGSCDFQYVASFFSPDIYCDGLTVRLNNQSQGGSHFAWDFGVPNTTSDTSSLFNPTFTFPDTGCYNIRLINEPTKPCRDTSYQKICLRDASIYADFKLKYKNCNDTVRLQAIDISRDSVFQVASWYWNWGSGSSTEQNPTIILNNSGTYTVTLEVTSTNGCKRTYRKTFNLTKFNVQKEKTIFICQGNSININTDGNPNLSYNWIPAATLDNPMSVNPLSTPLTTTTYSSTFVNYSLDTCTVVQNVTVDVRNDPPNPIIGASSITIYKGQSVTLDVQPIEGTATYVWEYNSYLADLTTMNQTIKPQTTSIFTVSAMRNPSGCVAIDTIQIFVKEADCSDPLIFLPNAFTPNGDGENDILYLHGNGVQELFLAIYNRYGEEVFHTKDQSIGWDGTYKGQTLPPDVFGFYLTVKCFGGKEYKKKGNISLLR